MADFDQKIEEAKEQLDAHVCDIIQWHFSPGTGCPFWLEWAGQQDWNPREEVEGIADLHAKSACLLVDNWINFVHCL